MKIKKLLLILIILTTLFFMSGCSYQELNDLAIASAIGIDYENNEFIVTSQILNFQKNEESSEENVILYEGKGETIGEAIRNTYLQYPNKLHMGHLELIVLNKNAANEKLTEIIDYFIRSPEARSNCYFMISTEGSAKDILTPSEESEDTFTANKIVKIVEDTKKYQGTTTLMTLDQVSMAFLSKGIYPVITSLKYEKDEEKYSNVISTGLVVLKENNKITDELTKEEATAYNIINKNFTDVMLSFEYQDNNLNVIIFNPSSKIDVRIKENKLKVSINLTLEGHISVINKKINLQKKENIKDIEHKTEEEVKKYIDHLINFNKENNIDTLNIKNKIYKNYYKKYKEYENKNIYEIAEINTNITVNLYRYGNTYKSIGDKNE